MNSITFDKELLVQTKKTRFIDILFVFFAFVALFGIKTSDKSNTMTYIICLMVFLLYLPFFDFKYINFKKIIIVLLPSLLWIYGIIVGLINKNETSYIFRNFSGMFFYLTCIVILDDRFSIGLIKKIVRIISYVVVFAIPILYFLFLKGIQPIKAIPFINNYNTADIGGNVYSFYYLAIVIAYVPFFEFINDIFYRKKFVFFKILYLMFFLFDVCYVSRLSGLVLQAVFLLFVFSLRFFTRNKLRILALIIISILALILLIKSEFLGVFSHDDAGNIIRYQQIDYVLSNFSVFGHGLGASYSEINRVYSIEVIYLDLVYKFGVFSFLLFALYGYSIIKALKIYLRADKLNFLSIAPITLMGFLVFSLGNPFLFSSMAIVCHIICLKIAISYNSYNKLS